MSRKGGDARLLMFQKWLMAEGPGLSQCSLVFLPNQGNQVFLQSCSFFLEFGTLRGFRPGHAFCEASRAIARPFFSLAQLQIEGKSTSYLFISIFLGRSFLPAFPVPR